MYRRLCAMGATLALALSALALVPSSQAADSRDGGSSRSVATPLGGLNIQGLGYVSTPEEADRAIAWAEELHAKLVRTIVPWAVLQPSGPGSIDANALAFTDRLVDDAAAHGIRVVMTVDTTPCWASSAPASLLSACKPGQPSAAADWPPSKPADYAAIVGALASRYGTRLAAIEVWNEPDHSNQHYFAGPNKPRRYAAILKAAYPAIKRANPAVQVLAGSLVGANGVFLRQLYAAGIKGYYDGLSVHFYNLVLASLRNIHEVQLAHRDLKPLWLDEFGWSSCWPSQRVQQEQGCVTNQAQATNISNVFRSLARIPWVAAEMVYELQGVRSEDFGVLTEAGAHKPSFAALGSVLLSPFGKPSPVTVQLSRRNGRIVASGSGPVGDYMQLEARNGRRLVYKAVFTLDRFNRYSLTLPKALDTRNLSINVFQYWMGTARAASARA